MAFLGATTEARRRRLLVVDDEPGLVAVLCETLAGLGHEVRAAADGAEALRVLGSEPVDLVISDLRMPRMDGMELLESAAGRGLDANFIFLTGYGTVENAVECMRLGAADYLLKPFRLEVLAAAVGKALAEREIREESCRADGMSAMRAVSEAARPDADPADLLRAFLVQVREVFRPEGMALMLFNGRAHRTVSGSLLKSDPAAVGWLAALAERLARSGQSKLIEPRLLLQAKGVPEALRGAWVMAAPLSGGSAAGCGAAVVVRGPAGPGYGPQDLRMFSVLSAHAALSLEGLCACRRLRDLNMEVVLSHVRAVEAKDPYTCGHSERVGEYAVRLGRVLGLGDPDLEVLRAAGYLHDVGKIGVPDRVLAKPGPLSSVEVELMRRHPVLGRDILCRVTTLRPALPAIEHHHERCDGAGYPGGLKAGDIPFLARVVSVVDAYEAITSDRAYQPARSDAEARRILARGAGSQWDREMVQAWLALLDQSGPVSA